MKTVYVIYIYIYVVFSIEFSPKNRTEQDSGGFVCFYVFRCHPRQGVDCFGEVGAQFMMRTMIMVMLVFITMLVMMIMNLKKGQYVFSCLF